MWRNGTAAKPPGQPGSGCQHPLQAIARPAAEGIVRSLSHTLEVKCDDS
jgi:hypothetical protein